MGPLYRVRHMHSLLIGVHKAGSLTNDTDWRVREQAINLLQNITTSAQEIAFTVKGLGTDRLVSILLVAMSRNDSETVEHVSSAPAAPYLLMPPPEHSSIEQYHNRISARPLGHEQSPTHPPQNKPFTLVCGSSTRLSELYMRTPCALSFPTP